MRHRKNTFKVGHSSSHRRCFLANMLKALIENESIVTTVRKAKELKKRADKMITLAKKNTLASKRAAIGELMVRFNSLTPKEARAAKEGDTSAYNADRFLIKKLFEVLGPRFAERQGGYTRLLRIDGKRHGDNAETCVIQFLEG